VPGRALADALPVAFGEARDDARDVPPAAADEVRRRHVVLPRTRVQRGAAGGRACDDVVADRPDQDHRRPVRDRQVASAAAAVGSGAAVDADLGFAHELADAADAVTLARFRALDLRVETKPDLTPVSEADRAAEEAVRSLVAGRRRGEVVLGEEGAGEDGAAR